MAEIYTKAFGRYLKTLRERRGLSLDDVRSLSQTFPDSLNKGYLSRVENGHQKLAFPKVIPLSRIYDVPADVLLERLELDMELDRVGGPDTDDKTYEELTSLGREAMETGSSWDAYGLLRDAVQRSIVDPVRDDLGDREEQIANAILNCGTGARALGRYRFALHEYLYLEQSHTFAPSRAILLWNRFGSTYLALRQWSLAEAYADRAISEAEALGDTTYLGYALETRAVLAMSQSQPDEAEPLLIRAHRVYKDIGNPLAAAHTLYNLAQCYFDSKRYGAARRTAGAASRLGDSLGARQIPILCAIVLGELDEVENRRRAAVTRWRKALDAARQLGNKKLRFQLEFVLFRRALRDGDKAVARSIQRRMRRLMHGVPADTPAIHDFEVLVKSNQHLFDKGVAETQPVAGFSRNP